MTIKDLFTRLWGPADLVEHTAEIAELVGETEIELLLAPAGDRAWLALTTLGMLAETQNGMFSPADVLAVAALWTVDDSEILPMASAIIEAATSE